VDVVPQLLVQESLSSALPSSHPSPELIWTTPSPQIVHGFSSASVRHDWPLAGHPTCGGFGLALPQMFGLPPARTAGQHSSPTGISPCGLVSHVSKSWFTMPSPHTAGKNSTVLPCPPPSA